MLRKKKPNKKEWLKIAQASPAATFFHTPYWLEVVSKNLKNHKNASLRLEVNHRTVYLPLIKCPTKRKEFSSAFMTSALGTYGGPISDTHLNASDIVQVYNIIKNKYPYLVWRLNPYSISDNSVAKSLNPDITKNDKAYRIDLGQGLSTIRASYSKGHSYNINSAKKRGINVKFIKNKNELKDYYRLYQDSLRRWQDQASNLYPFSLFKELHGMGTDHVRFWVASHQEENISGALVLYWNKIAIWWHGACSNNALRSYAGNLLQDYIIEDAKKRGYNSYDLNPSGGHLGVENSKARYGGSSFPAPVIYFEKPTKQLKYYVKKILKKA